ncbi:MAG: hypothetical protein IPJ01_06000 [Micavibrio sp.]|nr:hypothetical protein [Micavibrio sp.]
MAVGIRQLMRQGKNDLPRHAGILAGFGFLSRIPQHGTVQEVLRGRRGSEYESVKDTFALSVAMNSAGALVLENSSGAIRGGGNGRVAFAPRKDPQRAMIDRHLRSKSPCRDSCTANEVCVSALLTVSYLRIAFGD